MIIHVHKCLQHQNFVLCHMYIEVSNLASYTAADVYLKNLSPMSPSIFFVH